jgi:hypothetical protein
VSAALDRSEFITVHHEDFIRAPEATLSLVCAFLGLETDAGYLGACASITFEKPTNSRQRVAWTSAQVERIERGRQEYDFLRGYEFA